MNTAFRVIAALLLVGVLVGIGAGVYNAGVSQGLAQNVTAVASGAPAAAYGYYYPGFVGPHWGWGFGFFGIFFWILGIFLIFGLLRAAFGWGRGGRHYGRWGGYGPGGWKGPGTGDPRREMLDEWHRGAHGEADAGSGKTPAGG
ncbi:MAG: hypothetical protein M3P14_09415 [Chloroflexota bacterium]|nr:hypothetical protein [Chloroflexota bacterium]